VANVLAVLPLTIVMIAGPQIISAVFLATSEGWQRSSLAYLAGAALSIALIVSAAYLFVRFVKDTAGDANQRSTSHAVDVALLVLLLFLAARTYLKRDESEPPKWMGTLQTASPGFAFKLGFLLLGVFPTDIVSSITAGSFLAREGDPWWHSLLFVAATVLLLAIPALLVVLLGARAKAVLPKVRDWMTANSWVVSEFVILIFTAITISNLVGD
jgi:cytochrome c biogenesis protein CcdA